MKRILVLNGPNLNLTGLRQPEIYGHETLADMEADLRRRFPDVEFIFAQSNHEGTLIDLLHQYGTDGPEKVDGIVLNAGAYTHTSLALADAVAAISVPVVEVHISNIYAREEIRRRSLLAPVCRKSICGHGLAGYAMAVETFL